MLFLSFLEKYPASYSHPYILTGVSLIIMRGAKKAFKADFLQFTIPCQKIQD